MVMDELAAADLLDLVTAKEVETLDLLVQHRSNKQIALELCVSPRTVEERIASVRRKWGTRDRNDTARAYTSLRQACGKTTCGTPPIDAGWGDGEGSPADLPLSSVFRLDDVLGDRFEFEPLHRASKGPEALDARFGKLWRLVAIPVLALLLGMVLIWGIAFARALSDVI